MATNHPNPELHKVLSNAAQEGKITAELLQNSTKSGNLPTVEHDASAYVNWYTTLSLLGRAPAKSWFAGVSCPVIDPQSLSTSKGQDYLRDDLSVGVYYWWVDYELPKTSYFWVQVYQPANVLLIEVYDGYKLIALFLGTATMNAQIQGGNNFYFGGVGVWGREFK